ncbi:hypothetical protein M408DRAFT_266583 [Serendipita vermifera MAFF 305830]|uniref:Uncharacterized protein n=1 Tax=Serendipita vermifera MAFF 305830 TaxID=933852 RepID=A0A0C3AT22_SERVB|nr:hypothetical protein M408DRAFT_266583 [Serendipita vermifera MAFF 305830]
MRSSFTKLDPSLFASFPHRLEVQRLNAHTHVEFVKKGRTHGDFQRFDIIVRFFSALSLCLLLMPPPNTNEVVIQGRRRHSRPSIAVDFSRGISSLAAI